MTAEQFALKLFPVSQKEATCNMEKMRNNQTRKIIATDLREWLKQQIQEHEQANQVGQSAL